MTKVFAIAGFGTALLVMAACHFAVAQSDEPQVVKDRNEKVAQCKKDGNVPVVGYGKVRWDERFARGAYVTDMAVVCVKNDAVAWSAFGWGP
jgi:hypothetical protein